MKMTTDTKAFKFLGKEFLHYNFAHTFFLDKVCHPHHSPSL